MSNKAVIIDFRDEQRNQKYAKVSYTKKGAIELIENHFKEKPELTIINKFEKTFIEMIIEEKCCDYILKCSKCFLFPDCRGSIGLSYQAATQKRDEMMKEGTW